MQKMSTNKAAGTHGEDEVVKKVACPNCGKKLQLLPVNYPMYDVQCTACHFRAQVKTNNRSPQDEVFGAGWDVMNKVLKSGYSVPPLFINYHWVEQAVHHHEIRFYPFIPRTHLKKYELSQKAQSAGSTRFNYVGMKTLPHFVLFSKPGR
jgi:transcription elongation factor Elf1